MNFFGLDRRAKLVYFLNGGNDSIHAYEKVPKSLRLILEIKHEHERGYKNT